MGRYVKNTYVTLKLASWESNVQRVKPGPLLRSHCSFRPDGVSWMRGRTFVKRGKKPGSCLFLLSTVCFQAFAHITFYISSTTNRKWTLSLLTGQRVRLRHSKSCFLHFGVRPATLAKGAGGDVALPEEPAFCCLNELMRVCGNLPWNNGLWHTCLWFVWYDKHIPIPPGRPLEFQIQ